MFSPRTILSHSMFLASPKPVVLVLFLVSLYLGSSAWVWGQDVVLLKSADVGPYNAAASSFKKALSSDVEILEYDLQGDLAQGRKLGRKIRATPARLIVAIGLKAALAAKLEILDIPIITCMVLTPAKYDLNRNNITGVGLRVPIENQFALIRSLVPNSKRIGVLFDPTKTQQTVQQAKALAGKQSLELIERAVSSPQDVPSMLRSLLPEIDVLWLIPDSTVLTEDSLDFLLSTTLEARVPVLAFSSGLVRSGALAGLHINYSKVGKQVAGLAEELLKGKNIPQGTLLPPEQLGIAINRQIAQYLGIVVSPELLRDADEVY